MSAEKRSWSLVQDLKWQQLGLLAALWLVGALVATVFIVHETDEMFDNAMAETANAVLAFEGQLGLAGGIPTAEKLALAGDRRKYLSFQVRDRDGQVLARSARAPIEPYPVPLKPGYVGRATMRYLTRAIPGTSRFVQVAEFYDERRDAFLGLLAGFTLPLAGLLSLGALLLSRSAARVAKPIQCLGRELQLRDGSNMQLIENAGLPEELEPIVHDVNRLLARLKDAFEAERAFSGNCAHELRNPIAAATAQIEYVTKFPDDASNARRMQTIAASLTVLGHRIERLLQLSRAEAGLSVSSSAADLVEITRLLVDDAVLRGHRVSFDPGDRRQMMVAIDKDAVGIAVQNLIDNAVANGDPGALVTVSVDAAGSWRVVNACAPLSADAIARLPNRFQRDRAAKPGGYGLGLAIVSELVRQVGGTLQLMSPATGRHDGFEAIMKLPASPAACESDAKMTATVSGVSLTHQRARAEPITI